MKDVCMANRPCKTVPSASEPDDHLLEIPKLPFRNAVKNLYGTVTEGPPILGRRADPLSL